MQDLSGKVAVITGGASGIGLSLARRFGAEGMKLVLADVEATALNQAGGELREAGHEVLEVECDVSSRASLEALADATWSEFGGAHILANNAGVVSNHNSWDDQDAWDWVLGVDLMGVIYGVTTFVPRMLEAGEPGHIVNTASTAGLLSFPGIPSYNVAKHGVVALSQTMHFEFADKPLGVSVLCPGIVTTNIGTSERNRPGVEPTPRSEASMQAAEALTADEVANQVHDAVLNDTFWILPHPHYGEQAVEHAKRRLTGGTPVMPRINR